MTTRGYFGIAVFNGKTDANLGMIMRSAHVFGASFISIVGHRYRRQATDTTAAERHVPLYEFATARDFVEALPKGCRRIAVELCDDAEPVEKFVHPEQAVYILGPEDGSVPKSIQEQCHAKIVIPGRFCLNQAVAGSIVMYDRVCSAANRASVSR